MERKRFFPRSEVILFAVLAAGCADIKSAPNGIVDAGLDASGGHADGGVPDGDVLDAYVHPYPCGYNDAFAYPPCPEGFYCSSVPGTCSGCDGLPGCFFGICVPSPDHCPEEVDEVCGCNGVTYSNECLARKARVSVDFHDRCERTCSTNDDCGPAAFCGNTEGSEYAEWCVVEQEGRCVDFAPLCEFFLTSADVAHLYEGDAGLEELDLRVCGCDGNTYEHPCEAALEGRTNIKGWVRCPESSEGDGGVQ
jgi:hypothetical protein